MNKQEQLEQLVNQLKQMEAQFNQTLGAKLMLESVIKQEEESNNKEDGDNIGD